MGVRRVGWERGAKGAEPPFEPAFGVGTFAVMGIVLIRYRIWVVWGGEVGESVNWR